MGKFTPSPQRSNLGLALSRCWPKVVPITFSHSPCVVSNFPNQKPCDRVTSTWASLARRFGSSMGLPIVNLPDGHQQNFIFRPLPSHTWPAFSPAKRLPGGSAADKPPTANGSSPIRSRRCMEDLLAEKRDEISLPRVDGEVPPALCAEEMVAGVVARH